MNAKIFFLFNGKSEGDHRSDREYSNFYKFWEFYFNPKMHVNTKNYSLVPEKKICYNGGFSNSLTTGSIFNMVEQPPHQFHMKAYINAAKKVNYPHTCVHTVKGRRRL